MARFVSFYWLVELQSNYFPAMFDEKILLASSLGYFFE